MRLSSDKEVIKIKDVVPVISDIFLQMIYYCRVLEILILHTFENEVSIVTQLGLYIGSQ